MSSQLSSNEIAQFFAIFFGSFVSEDAAVFSAGMLWKEGQLSFWLAFTAAFTGIFVGDVGVYYLAKWFGPPLARSKLGRRLVSAATLDRGKALYARWGIPLLAAVRFIPGMRVAVYVGAGLFGCSTPLFLGVVGGTGLLWVGFCFGLAAQLRGWKGAALFVGLCVFFVAIGRAVVEVPYRRRLWVRYYSAARWRYFEFWSPYVFYVPVVFYYAWLSIRFRNPLLPASANPGIEGGGLIGESKARILDPLLGKSDKVLRHRIFEAHSERAKQMLEYLEEVRLTFPVILKPDVGQRGSGVQLVRSETQLTSYCNATSVPVLLQEYCDYENEVGVFYFRRPGQPKGEIFSITSKEFPVVVGDGQSVLGELILSDRRARWMSKVFFKRHQAELERVLAAGEVFRLVESGNHCQGTVFRQGKELGSAALSESLDRVADALPGFHVGRFDLKYRSRPELSRGEAYKIVEINGAGAEATHIYDPQTTLVEAYRVLFAQWRLIFELGDEHRSRGVPSLTPRGFCKSFLSYKKLKRSHPMTS